MHMFDLKLFYGVATQTAVHAGCHDNDDHNGMMDRYRERGSVYTRHLLSIYFNFKHNKAETTEKVMRDDTSVRYCTYILL